MSIYAFDRGKGNFTTKYIFQFARILAFCFLGEILHVVLPLPVPASVYGLVLLLAALNFKLVKLDDVKEVGTYPVSYTHLDVYKRQGNNLRDDLLCPVAQALRL